MKGILATVIAVAVCIAQVNGGGVWPLPREIRTSPGPFRDIESAIFQFVHPINSVILEEAIGRAKQILDGAGETETIVFMMDIKSGNEKLDGNTNYSYEIEYDEKAGVKTIQAQSIFGAIYALETITQLTNNGKHIPLSISIKDSPQHNWRGLMIDSGRRFFPVPLVKNLLDTMAAVKLNVLHLHASDHCRFGVESKLYPDLTDALTGLMGGFYTQDDIADLISYAKGRGIRVVPEFDVPGHSRGFLPIEGAVQFCTSDQTRSQLYNDPQGDTMGTLKRLFKEMAGLFEDAVFNIGSDETSAKGVCDENSTYSLERELLTYINTTLEKTPEGWEEVLFDNGAATMQTIVDGWSNYPASSITQTGRFAVESAASHFYFTEAAPNGPEGWSECWYNISSNIPASQSHLLLGGEMSMWTDTYCYIDQCGSSSSSSPPVGHQLFGPSYDSEFSRSVAGMIWPRGFVAAAAFWNFNATANPSSIEFVNNIFDLNDGLIARGSLSCPSNCSCDQLTACGIPYIYPLPGNLSLSECSSSSLFSQQFDYDSRTQKFSWRMNASMCIDILGTNAYPLTLHPCSVATSFTITSNMTIVANKTGQCVDLREADGAVGVWECGAGVDTQENQHWAYESESGVIASLDENSHGGMCITVDQENDTQ
eukprot:m.11494 g.11494  ORF g.11494 m.11494 type:complete len:653 (-) comp3847_c0_seq1:89-2047(-)